jgi:uncharacterized protein YifE (UPF0438 family)
MITNIDQFVLALEQMGRMFRMLESYKKDILPKNPRTFVLFCEGPLEQIRQLQAQIDEFLDSRHNEPAPETAALRETPDPK